MSAPQSCWLAPPIDVRPLADFSGFGSVRLATARDGRPQVVVQDGIAGRFDLYYLDLTQSDTSYYHANGQAVAQRSTDLLQEESHVYYLHHDLSGNPSAGSGQALTEVTGADQTLLGRARACPELAEGTTRWARC